MRSCVRCKCMYESRDMMGALCPFCAQQLRPTPAPEEKEMEPIERLAVAAEKYVEKCEENEPMHKHFVMAQLNHIDRQYEPMTRAAERRALYERAYLAALTSCACSCPSDHAALRSHHAALETVRRWPEFMKELTALQSEGE